MKETAPRGLLPGGIANPLRKNNPIANTRQNRNNNSAIKMFDHLEFLLRNQKRFGVVGCCCCCDTDSATLGGTFCCISTSLWNHFFRCFPAFGIIDDGLIWPDFCCCVKLFVYSLTSAGVFTQHTVHREIP